MISDATQAVQFELPHAVRERYQPSRSQLRPFGSKPPLVPHDFAQRLIDRQKAGDRSYDPMLAYALSVIAGWSYSDGQTLSNKLKYCGFGFNTLDEVAVTNSGMLIVAAAFFARSECGRVGVLSFRGTDPASVINWMTDTEVFPKAFTAGHVHAGFYDNLQAIWDDVSIKLEDAVENKDAVEDRTGNGREQGNGHGQSAKKREPLQALYITGHSLGGAMAVLAAAKICGGEGPVPADLVRGVYTFGQPAVGDAAFAAQCQGQFADRLFRHIFHCDVVPHMPPRSAGPFVHFGQERVSSSIDQPWKAPDQVLSGQSRLLTTAAAVTLMSWAARRLPSTARIPLWYSIDDHSPARYIEASRAQLVS